MQPQNIGMDAVREAMARRMQGGSTPIANQLSVPTMTTPTGLPTQQAPAYAAPTQRNMPMPKQPLDDPTRGAIKSLMLQLLKNI